MKRFFALLIVSLFILAACGHLTEDGTGLLFATADPNLSIGFRLLPGEAAVVPEEEVGEVLPVPPLPPPCEMIVKGNISTRTGDKIAHVPTDPNYNQVKIDEAAGEKFFCTLDEAIAEGWRAVR